MLPRAAANGVVWMEGGGGGDGEEEEDAASWTRTNNEGETSKNEDMGLVVPLSSYKSMLENDWYMNNNAALNPPRQDLHNHLHGLPNPQDVRDISFCSNPNDANSLLLQPLDSSSSCSPSQAFTLDPSQSQPPFLPHKSCFSSLINAVCT